MKVLEIKGESDLQMVWLHGYGANAWDLYPLAEFCDPEGYYNHYFPNAPMDLYGQGERGPRAWFPLDLNELNKLGAGGGGLKLSQQRRDGALGALPEIDLFFEQYEIDTAKLVLGGFSQGAILALHWMLERQAHLRGLVLMSGAPLDEIYLQKTLPSLAGQNFFQSHGMHDDILSFAEAEKLRIELKKAGFKGKWLPFNGGHSVPEVVMAGIRDSLKSWR